MIAAAELKQQFRDFVSIIPEKSQVAVLGHSDVDGLAATAIMTRTFEHLGHRVWPYVTKKGENAWSEEVLAIAAAHKPNALAVVDLGSRSDSLLAGVQTLIVDHHKPTGVPPDATLLSGYGREPTPSSGLLSFWCAQEAGAEDNLAWLAAASMLADYGNTSAFSETQEGAKAAGAARLRKLVSLLNAPRRTASGDANPVLQMLLHADDAALVLQGPAEETLLAAKQEVDEALGRARKIAPKFAGIFALILIDEGCQVHPLIAQTWRNRLRKNVVLCANVGYLPGRVNFAVRTATGDNLIELLDKHRPAGAGEEYGRGHDKATGGSLEFPVWQEFISSLGFRLLSS